MTYEHILDVARRHAPTPPPFHRVWETRASRLVDGPPRAASGVARRIVLGTAAALTLSSIGGYALEAWSSAPGGVAVTAIGVMLLMTLGMAGPLVVALLTRRRRSVVSQVLVRAAGWSMMEFFVVLTFLSGPGVAEMSAPMCLGIAVFFAVALLLLRDTGLDALDSEFQPRAYRGRLLGTLVLAFADAQTLVMITALQLSLNFPTAMIVLPGVAALVMIAATWGLARLRVWGLVLNVGANLVVAALAVAGYMTTAVPFVVALAATAVVQVLLVLPLVRVVLGGHGEPSSSGRSRFRWAAIALVVPMLIAAGATALVQTKGHAITSWSCPTLSPPQKGACPPDDWQGR